MKASEIRELTDALALATKARSLSTERKAEQLWATQIAAIQRAIELAEEGDIVLLAGKGHETYQIRGTTSYPFDEKEIVRELTGSHA